MTAEDAKNWAILIGAVLGPLTTIVLAYFTYRANMAAKQADTKAQTALNATEGLRRTLETTQTIIRQGMEE